MTNTNQLDQRPLKRSHQIILTLAVGGLLALTSCGSARTNLSESAPSSADKSASLTDAKTAESNLADQGKKDLNAAADTSKVTENAPTIAKPQRPQLIKTAYVSLKLDSIDQSITKLRELSKSTGGDIYSFQDNQSADRGDHRKASLVVKVPVAALDSILASIAKLGKVQNQKLDSNDVTQQIVDSDARLKNLRQQEDQTRKIMERAGSINDTLRVSESLANIREQIEQIDAQIKNMRQQVAYSTINLELEELQAVNPSGDPFGLRVQETWKNSTGTASSLATNIMLTVLWLVPFTPLLAAGGAGFYWLRRRKKSRLVNTLKAIEVEEAT